MDEKQLIKKVATLEFEIKKQRTTNKITVIALLLLSILNLITVDKINRLINILYQISRLLGILN